MTRIDMHVHIVPDAYRELSLAPDGSRPFRGLGASLEGLDLAMIKYEIDAAVISTGPPGAYLGDQGRANEAARAANEALAAIVRDDPGRFGALALLPLPDVDAALAELTYALDHLKLDGVALLTNTAGVYLGDPSWDVVYAELDRRGAYVFVHPTVPGLPVPLADVHPIWMYELPIDTTRALANLIYTGTLERYQSIRFQFAHLGGATPFLAARFGMLAKWQPDYAAAATAGVAEYLSRVYYDTALSHDLGAIGATRSVSSLEHIVFGTDWPYLVLPEEPGDPAPELAKLPARERDAIDYRNAAALIPRLVGPDLQSKSAT
jgi:predicted TIM-barrel fold metal-dependent hydrolase